ncbi:MAG: hypothetical protein ABIN89_08270 [Chitinophagaceae bacterium]
MKKLIILVAIFSGVFIGANAQSDYKSAIGGRLGSPISFSFKQFIIKDAGAIELNAGFAPVGYGAYFRIGGMYQHHFPIKPVEGLKWYVGGGIFADFYHYDNQHDGYGYSKSSPGVNAVGGVDYKFKTIPLNLSADWTPSLFFNGDLYYSGRFRPGYGAISVRYVLK